MTATIRTPGTGRTVAVVGDVYRFLATGADTNGTYALWEALVPPGAVHHLMSTAGRKRASTSSKASWRFTPMASASWRGRGCS